ncbi:MAG: V-type ATP synthase subunit E [Halobacteria archaeon]|nr:V-type ATP synthase subunit E [Halobacteria archaeon]
MGLETVVQDITEEARARAEEIREEAEQEADEIVKEAEQEAEEIIEEAEQEVENQIKREREQTLSSAKLEAKQLKLRARKELLEELRQDVENELAELEDGRQELTRMLLDSGIEEIDEDTGTVYAAGKDEDMVREMLDTHDGFDFGGTSDMLGGVIVESGSGQVRIDNTFDSILDEVWNQRLSRISSELFGEE